MRNHFLDACEIYVSDPVLAAPSKIWLLFVIVGW